MTYKTAWYVCHRIRDAMTESEPNKLGGNGVTVEIDETYIGGIYLDFIGHGSIVDAEVLWPDLVA
jgi:hypothetical protein